SLWTAGQPSTAMTMSDTVVIINSLIGKTRANQCPGLRKAATPSADGIESVMFTYRFMEDQSTVFTDVQRSEASPCTGGCASTHTVDSAVNAPWIHEGPTADYCVRTGYREVHAAGVCPEAQLMAGSNSVIYLTNDEGPVVRLLRWVAGLCGGSDLAVHGCPEGQLMAGNSTIYQNGLVQWLLR
uniref:Uncharacterized protein n=1 Tax=Aegilops tauschii subsp. strangulata TaxID=200361 RepID=A0A452XN39_AEGTS